MEKEFYLSIDGNKIQRIGGQFKAGDVKEHFKRLNLYTRMVLLNTPLFLPGVILLEHSMLNNSTPGGFFLK